MRAMRTLRLSQDGDSATALAQAEKQGQAVIKRLGGDVLVWGEVVRVNGMQPVLRLRLVLKDGSGGGGRTVGYALTPALELPQAFGADLGGALAALVVAQSVPAEKEGSFVAEVLAPVLPKLERLLERPPAALTPDQRINLRETLALLLARGGDQRRSEPQGYKMLERSAEQWRAAAQHWRGKDTLREGSALSNLGYAIVTLGEQSDGQTKVKQAIGHYREALKLLKSDGAAFAVVAETQIRLGDALRAQAEHDGTVEVLPEAEAALREALTQLESQAQYQRQVGQVLNKLGDTLRARAEHEAGVGALDEAEKVLLRAVPLLKHDEVPLLWAEVNGNLADVLYLRGSRESNAKRLDAAVVTYSGAQAVWEQHKMVVDGAALQFKRCNALRALGLIEKAASRLDDAVGHCRQSVAKLSPKENAVYWGEAQLALARALHGQAQLRKDAKPLQEAAKAAKTALDVFAREKARTYEGQAREALGRIEASIKAGVN